MGILHSDDDEAPPRTCLCPRCCQGFTSHLQGAESIAEQIQLMKDNVCPQLGVDGCEDILDMWYPDMAGCIFNHFLVESDACGLAGLCYVRDWTCDECSMLMSQLAAFMTEEEAIAEGVSSLQGECFCGQEGHTESCPDLVSGVVPLAMPVLAAALTEKTVEHCQEIVNVC